MKKIINISKAMMAVLLAVVLSLFASCENKFEESWELEVNSNEVTVPYEAGQYAVGCFCNGAWKAYLEREVSWAHLENAEGVGTGYVRFIYTQNNVKFIITNLFHIILKNSTICIQINHIKNIYK